MSASELRRVAVGLGERSYEVVVGEGALDEAATTIKMRCPAARKVCIASDSNVAPLYAAHVAASLTSAGFETSCVSFPAGESHKNMDTLHEILEEIATSELSRDDVVCALGGGVTGDMAGLAAALYLRGCKLIQMPTSLLAMVDSSVGGKLAVDLAAGKNLAGVFLQPEAVLADIGCLATLSPELIRDSTGEIIKHAVLADPALFEQLSTHPIPAGDYTSSELRDIVVRNVEIKRDVVEADEREHGLRQTLNLGHTIGHAIEAASNFELGHGSSVAAGLCCIARASAARGWCEPRTAAAIETCVAAQGLPTDTALPHDVLMRYIMHDKKRHADTFNVVIPRAIGRVEIRKLSASELRDVVDLGCGVELGQRSAGSEEVS